VNKSLAAMDYVYSEFGSDPDMAELIELFVANIPNKIADLEASVAAADWGTLGTLAHQLKGAAGGYGFHQLTQPALQVEVAAREAAAEEDLLDCVQDLLEMCRRVRSGTPGG
jgi:histidine phosphotransfer protein HptB